MTDKQARNRFHGELLKRIVNEYREGATTHELAFKYDTHQSTIARALKRVGCPLRSTGRQPGKKPRWGTSDKHRKASLKSMYGLTPLGYRQLHSQQGGVCAICGKELPSEWKRGACIDHDHKTKKVRGLLCMHCNHGLGKFQDSISVLGRAADYLAKHGSHDKHQD
jgi:Recombination endonuclease VII